MNKVSQLASVIVLFVILVSCQNSVKKEISSVSFDEPTAPQLISPVQNWNALEEGVLASWACSNQRYHKEYIPDLSVEKVHSVKGWKNEQLNAQMVLWSKDSICDLAISIGDLKSNNSTIPSNAIKHYYVRNVLSDEFLGGCGYKTKNDETTHLVPDCLEEAEALTMREKSTRGVWFTIDIPENSEPGKYTADVIISVGGKMEKSFELNVDVLNRTLPTPDKWKYELDLWQNPYALVRVHDVVLWSPEHFEKMKPLFTILADAGQKCITASVLNKPWGGQSFDSYESMVKHTLKQNGEWEFEYSIFDKWVEFMMDLGIDKQINCYSLIPWGNQLAYFDEELERDTFIVANASLPEFAQYWIPFLEDFSKHLKAKGWFDITTIAMDERPLKAMMSAIKLINEHSGLKITSAANYAPGTSEHVYDLSVESKHILPDEVLEQRKANGQKTTYYVCCSAEYPNNFTYSPPAEGVWQGWYAFAKKQDGFLRWAYNSWVEEPLKDTRFRTWPAGDTFFIYPGPKSSIRWEKLREGIQDFEKLQIITEELTKSDTPESKIQLQKIEEVLSEFEIENIKNEGALIAVQKGKDILNNL